MSRSKIVDTGNKIVNLLNKSNLTNEDQARVLSQVLATMGSSWSSKTYEEIELIEYDQLIEPDLAKHLLLTSVHLLFGIDSLEKNKTNKK